MSATWLSSFLAAGVLSSSPVVAAPLVYGESAMVKVQPGAIARADTGVGLTAGRNEFVSFQVVVNGNDVGATQVSAALPSLTGPGGRAISGADISLYREAFLNIVQTPFPDAQPGLYPDPLVPDVDELVRERRSAFPFDVPARAARTVWVDLHVPADAPAGLYLGTLTVSAQGGFRHAVNVTLTVGGYALPSTASLPTSFRCYPANICLAHTGSPDCNGNTTLRQALLGRYERLALEHRFSCDNLFEPPAAGGDWSGFDAFAGPFLEGTAPSRLAGAKVTSLEYLGAQSAAAYADFESHVSAKGWLDRAFDYTADEPPGGTSFAALHARAALVHSAAPLLRTMATTTLNDATASGVLGDLDILTPVVNWMDGDAAPYLGDTRPQYDSFLTSAQKKVWMYQSCMSQGCATGGTLPENTTAGGWPSYAIEVPAARNRAMQWSDFLERVGGELYYETALSLPTAWSDQYQFNGNGDGNLWYPGTAATVGGATDIPVAGIRLKMLRLGLQDYELLKLVSDSGDPAFARSIAQTLLPATYRAMDDGAAYDRARLQLVSRLNQLLRQAAPAQAQGAPPASPAADLVTSVRVGGDPVTTFIATPELAVASAGSGPDGGTGPVATGSAGSGAAPAKVTTGTVGLRSGCSAAAVPAGAGVGFLLLGLLKRSGRRGRREG